MKLIHKGERGFTLIELLIAIVIAGLITGGITFAIMQILTINTRASNHMVAVRQVQQAGKEVSKDALQAQGINATGSWGFPLILTWTEWGTNQTHTVRYELVGAVDEAKKLQRSHSVTGGNSTNTTVAEYIDPGPGQTSCVWNATARVLIFKVTATVGGQSVGGQIVGGQSETRIYEVEPRPGS